MSRKRRRSWASRRSTRPHFGKPPRQAIAANPKAVADFKKGKEQAKMSIVGAIMKTNKGAPNDVVRRLVDEELAKV